MSSIFRTERHPTVPVKWPSGHRMIEIDTGMKDLIEVMWSHRILTSGCCQEIIPGVARIEFFHLQHMADFYHEVAVGGLENTDALFDCWKWSLRAGNGLHGWLHFPCSQIGWATEQIKKYG